MQTKEEYLAEKALEYERIKQGKKLALELENRIADIKAMGYKLIVLGSTVKITLVK